MKHLRVFAAFSFLLAHAFAQAATPSSTHPLDALTEEEIAIAVQTVKKAVSPDTVLLFPYVALNEPDKKVVQSYSPKPGGADATGLRRVVSMTTWQRAGNRVVEWEVDLQNKKVLKSNTVVQGQPPIMLHEYKTVPALVRKNAKFQEAMKRRGIMDVSEVVLDVWAIGPVVPKKFGNTRIVRVIAFHKGKFTNQYSHPVEGLSMLFDVVKNELIELKDTGLVQVSSKNGDFDSENRKNERPVLAPLVTAAPSGVRVKSEGNQIAWDRWKFRFSLHPREGMVLHTATFDGRPVLHRASLSEMVVPYGDADPNWVWRNAFDVGEYGIGRMVSTQELGSDTPSNAQLFDAVLADDFGAAYKIPGAISVFERDGGILWRHYEAMTERLESRRSTELVLQFIATISNYDYAMSWVFRQDGTLALESDLTGIMLAKGFNAAKGGAKHDTAHHTHPGHLVSPGISAIHHQHFFSFRIDLDVDGNQNTAYEMNTRSAPAGPKNPWSNAIIMEEVALKNESAARRDLQMSTQRKWKFASSNAKNSLGEATSYALIPGENSLPYVLKQAPVRKKATFLEHHFWVTRYKQNEQYAAGDYPNQGNAGEGLALFSNGESTLNEDIVLWYTLGVTHIPRPEEWPVMPVHKTGFRLVPVGFFGENPTMGPKAAAN